MLRMRLGSENVFRGFRDRIIWNCHPLQHSAVTFLNAFFEKDTCFCYDIKELKFMEILILDRGPGIRKFSI